MSDQGDDCYFYYYSTCAKGDSCPFRHCEAAIGSEVVCSLWQESRCFRKVCKFRHMEIKKKRNEIACYWENQPVGCQKAHCAFHHEKPRLIDGVYVPPSKGPALKKDREEGATPLLDPPTPVPVTIANSANPQLRGVIKAETLENVPSPTHPPVVINPADDEDEDEDDQYSEEGEEMKSGSDTSRKASPRKGISSTNKDETLNFGIKTLEEIRLRKALKANLKRPGQLSTCPSQAASHSSSGARNNNGMHVEKSFVRTSRLASNNDAKVLAEQSVKRRIAERLGKRKAGLTGDQQVIINKDSPEETEFPLKHRLAERLGRKVDCPENSADRCPEKALALKSLHDRLGLSMEPAPCDSEDCGEEVKSPGEIRIKTLDEIRQEKAAKSQGQVKGACTNDVAATLNTPSPVKRASKALASTHVRTFSEALHAKKKLEEREAGKEPKAPAEDTTSQQGEVRVKTLEEIRREKAMRIQANGQDTKPEKTLLTEEGFPKKRILRLNKAMAQGAVHIEDERTVGSTGNLVESSPSEVDSSGEVIKVKTFEEIMREKRLRQQQVERVATSVQPEDPCSAPKPALALPRERSLITARQRVSTDPQPSEVSPTGSRQRVALNPRDTVPLPSVVLQGKLLAAVEKMEADSLSTGLGDSTPTGPVPPPVPLALTSHIHEEPQTESKVIVSPKKSPVHASEPKVRPKLNVKPSVVKPTTQVELGRKRIAPQSHRSAIAAVKPLNSTPGGLEDKLQEVPCKHAKTSASSATLEIDVQDGPQVLKQSVSESSPQNCDCLEAEPPAVSVLEPSRAALKPAHSPTKETHALPLSSPVALKTPQPKFRRLSVSARTAGSTVDDFEELMNEFTDDRLEDEMVLDPGKGEDDLLLELSEMIGS